MYLAAFIRNTLVVVSEAKLTILHRQFLKSIFVQVVSANVDVYHGSSHEMPHFTLVLYSVLVHHFVKNLERTGLV